MASYTQTGQPLTITTPLGANVLLLEAFTGHEEMGRLFHFELELLSTTTSITPAKIVGQKVSFSVQTSSGKPRWFTGYVSRFSWMGYDGVLTRWRAEVVPGLWFASLTTDCKIFQNQTISTIITTVLEGTSQVTVSKKLTGTYPSLVYCVQYRESDFAFVSRWCEFYGISYFFQHADNSLTTVLFDANSAFAACTDSPVEAVQEFASPSAPGQVVQWRHDYGFCSGKYAQTDFWYQQPKTSLLVSTTSNSPYTGASKYDLFDYPGGYTATSNGQTLANVRMQQAEMVVSQAAGRSTCSSFSPGSSFTIKTHPWSTEKNQQYVLTAVTHRAHNRGAYEPTQQAQPVFSYENDFTCIPIATTFRPARTTPWPVGTTQTATVVGSSGSEIYTNNYGQVVVQFHWDRYGKNNQSSSCYIRVAQALAGPQWGAQFIPRVGMEVIVDHLDNDIDRPIITGAVYNATNMPAFTLPANASESGLQTRSTTKGTSSNTHQLIFNDTKGSELITFHSELNFIRSVENNDTLTIGQKGCAGGNRGVTVWNNLTESIGQKGCTTGNHKVTVWNNLTESIGQTGCASGSRTTTVLENDSRTVTKGNDKTTVSAGNSSLTVTQGSRTVTVGNGHTLSVTKGNSAITVNSGSHSVKTLAGAQIYTAGTSITLAADTMMSMSAKTAMSLMATTTMALSADTEMSLSSKLAMSLMATTALRLSVGENSISITPVGITIMSGPSTISITPAGIEVAGLTMTLGSADTMLATVQGLLTTVRADTVMTVQGPITMIGA